MKPELTITIKKQSLPEFLSGFLIVMPLCIGALSALSESLYSVRYLMDLIWVFLLLLMILFRQRIRFRNVGSLQVWTVIFFLYSFLAYIPQYQSGIYYLWAVRNNFRFYVTFFAFTAFLTARGVKSYYKLYDFLFWVNFVVALFQFMYLDLRQDFLGGIFGASEGTNGYSNIFMAIIITKSVVMFLNRRESSWQCALKCAAAILVAAMAEMKFFFLEFVFIVIMASVYTGFFWRKLAVIAGGIAAAVAGAALLTVYFPYFADWFSVEWFLDTALSSVGYTGAGDLNRLTAILEINELWLKNFVQRLVGLGMGNCETASFELLQTPFFRQHGDLHYSWIAYAMMYLECGWIGLIFYFGFFALVYLKLCMFGKSSDKEFRCYVVVAKIAVMLCVIISIYNNTMRSEPAYMMYFAMAAPFVLRRERSKTVSRTSQTNAVM